MKRACIVGYGAIGPIHAKALESIEQVQLYAICDIDEEKRNLCKEQYSVIEYDDFDRMLLDEMIDSVHICTPHYLHFEMIKKALAAGKDVVVEKPMTMTREEYHELLQLEGVEKVCVVLQNRLNPCTQKLKELIRSGEFGSVRAAKGVLTWNRDQAYYESGDWRGKWDTEGGGVLINQAVHTLDYFSYLVDDVVSVKANMFNYSLENVIEVEDTFTASLNFKNNVKGIFFATNAYPVNSDPLFEVVFENGVARYTDKKLWVNGQLIAEDASPTIGKAYWGSGHEALLKRYYDGHEYFTIMDALNTMETMFAMYDSAKNGGKEYVIHE